MKCFAVYEQPRPGAPYQLVTWQRRRRDVENWITDPLYGRTRVILKGDSQTLPSRLLVREARRLRQETTLKLTRRCDRKFVDSVICLKCGWKP